MRVNLLLHPGIGQYYICNIRVYFKIYTKTGTKQSKTTCAASNWAQQGLNMTHHYRALPLASSDLHGSRNPEYQTN